MKLKVLCFLLATSVAAFAQGHGGGRPAGPPAGRMGQGGPSMPTAASSHASRPDMQQQMGQRSAHVEMAKQSPDAILNKNTKLNSNLEKLLPQGTTAQQACSGFKNLGDCVAAIHVSNNLGISFEELKTKTTGDNAQNLGKVVHELKPEVDAKAEVKKAKKQANADLSESSS